MAIRKWTKAQDRGITTTEKSLLVSAAAGSGKTTVLAERCVHLVCDANPRCGIDELLVVTFTEAAAAEMKGRIHRALAERHAREPSDHTARQLAIIDRASVGTLHGFCARLLRQHFHLLGLDPDFLILDPDEVKLLKGDVARDIFADRYDRDDSDAFRRFVDGYGEGNDERLVALLIQAQETLGSVLDQTGWMNQARRRIVEAIELPMKESELGREFSAGVLRSLNSIRAECAAAGAAIKVTSRFPEYVEHLRILFRILNDWLRKLDSDGLDGLIEEAAEHELPAIPRLSNKIEGKESAKERVDEIRKAMKEGNWRESARFTEEEWKHGLRQILPHVDTFLSLLEEFSAGYAQAKEREGGLDFSDLERFTLAVLRDAKAEGLLPSAVARSYHQQYQHVLVDEYQDINEVQDAILSLISRECLADRPRVVPNLFCVGDVKQSIYRFRLAEPLRFLNRRKEYLKPDGHGEVIDLQQNFRSRAPLLSAINGVFEKLMTVEAADLDYDKSQRLEPGLDFPADDGSCFSGAPIELHLLPKDVSGTEVQDEDRSDREAALLAHRILAIVGKKQVIDRSSGSPVARVAKYGDIVVLLRSLKYKADVFAQGLRNAGIRVHSASATGYFEATEINDVLSLLKVLDNQRQDIPLAAFLRSPLAALPKPEDSLARIHLAFGDADPAVPFHVAVIRYANEKRNELAARLRALRNQLNEWRKLARRRPLAEVLWTILDQTGYLAFCAGLIGGEQRQANLIELHERARQFGSFRRQGLSRFLEFLERLKSESDLGQASFASEAEDVVRIMSIHRAKGLEFPIVMVPDLAKAFNLRDGYGSILLDRAAGLGLDVVDEERQIRYPSLASTVVKQRLNQQAMAEELRVLYVAMTRAKEHLILCGTCEENRVEKWSGQWAAHKGALPTEMILSAGNMLSWLGPVAVGSPDISIETHSAEEIAGWIGEHANLPVVPKDLVELKPLDPAPAKSEAAEEIIDRVSRAYPFEEQAKRPAAQSVTKMSKNGAWMASALKLPADVEIARMLLLPGFLVGKREPDAADRGTATHAVLEHLDFRDAADEAAVVRQIETMTETRRISAEQAGWVDVETILWLMNQSVGKLLADERSKLHRELPVYFAEPGDDPMDRVMVRGRLDVLVETVEGLVIVDYKTDRVSGVGVDERAAFYEPQLKLYREAIEGITKRKVIGVVLLFLGARECRWVRDRISK